MTIDPRLLALLVCPVCKGPLKPLHQANALSALACKPDRLAFPVRDGMPVMLESEALAWDPDTDVTTAPVPLAPA